jgi:RNA polymerase sigma factor for flagellar operon FliA
MVTLVEEQELWVEFTATRAPELREQLILQAVPLVHYMLGRMGITREIGGDYEDLVHQGLLGLMDAVDRFDLRQGTRFSTYAGIRIRGKVIDYLRSCDWMSRAARRRVRMVQDGVARYWSERRRQPTDEELADFLQMDLEAVQQGLFDATRILVSLDVETDSGQDEEVSLYETQADEAQPDPSELYAEQDRRARMAAAIRRLPEREQQILSLYYFEELTLKEIGKVMQVSESRVCQLHARAILNVKAMLQYD